MKKKHAELFTLLAYIVARLDALDERLDDIEEALKDLSYEDDGND